MRRHGVLPKARPCLLAAAALFIMLAPVANAADPVGWGLPERLTSEGSMVQFSSIVADPYGAVYAFWAHAAGSDEPTNVLFCSSVGATESTVPIDLFVGLEGDVYSLPQAFSDASGRLHLIWSGLQGLYYSSAPAGQALSVKRWSEPYLIARAQAVGSTSLLVGREGPIHLFYTRRTPGSNVVYVRSDDLGASWTEPLAISSITVNDEQAPDSVEAVSDSQGVIHLVWAENYPPDYIGRQVLYARSDDGGVSWSAPAPLSGRSGEETWNALPEIVVDSLDRLHVMWAGNGAPPRRAYRTSSDGGDTWSDTLLPSVDLRGSSGRDAMVTDAYGHVYWAGALRYPQAFYFAALTDGPLEESLQLLVPEGSYGQLAQAHFPQAAISNGNRVHLLIVEADAGHLWHLQGTTSSPATAPAPLPTSSVAEPTASPMNADSTRTVPTETAVPRALTQRGADNIGGKPLVVAFMTALGLVMAVVVAKSRRPKR